MGFVFIVIHHGLFIIVMYRDLNAFVYAGFRIHPIKGQAYVYMRGSGHSTTYAFFPSHLISRISMCISGFWTLCGFAYSLISLWVSLGLEPSWLVSQHLQFSRSRPLDGLIVIRLRVVASALIVIRLRAAASALIVIRLRAATSALMVIRLRAVASALIVIRLRVVASALMDCAARRELDTGA
ncbi:hypothetical protein OROHE_000229 [Orobanche hederae]